MHKFLVHSLYPIRSQNNFCLSECASSVFIRRGARCMNKAVHTIETTGRLIATCLLSTILAACSGGSGGELVQDQDEVAEASALTAIGADTADGCTVADINQWIDERMRDTYIFYDRVPVLDLSTYDDPQELVRDLRVFPDIYSSLGDKAQDEALISNSNVTRFGFSLRVASDGRQHFSSISGNSPMEGAGIQRGDELVAINSIAIDDITDEQWLEFIVGESDKELTAVFTVKSGASEATDFIVTKTTYTESTVPVFGTYEQTNNEVGYMQVTAFRGTTADEIDTAVQFLAEAGISELILDLRYNGGGFTAVARQLASQIAGPPHVDEVYSRRTFNDKFSEFDRDFFIEPQALNLELSRLMVLTTARTASASETLVNGLSPLIDVVVIGALTEGKPFTSVAQDFCGRRLHAMSTLTTNGADESVLGGLIPTCEVEDDFLAPADSISDALTGAAFNYIQFGACPNVQSKLVQLENRSG